jgi:hypothetical protein
MGNNFLMAAQKVLVNGPLNFEQSLTLIFVLGSFQLPDLIYILRRPYGN